MTPQRRFRCGLVIGKFSPLHRGHEALIRFARERCEQLVVLSYSNPEFDGCKPPTRRRWLRDLFPEVLAFVLDDAMLAALPGVHAPDGIPSNDAPDTVQRRFVAEVWSALVGGPLDAVFTSEEYGAGLVDALNDHFREHTIWPAHIQHCAFDPERLANSVCGTIARVDPLAPGLAISPRVRADFVTRVAVVGGESSGKTTLVKALAAVLEEPFVAEYGRTLWEERCGHLVYEDLLHIAQTHVAQEDAAAQRARRCVIIDTTPLTTLFYSLDGYGRVDPGLLALSHRAYDHVFVCAPDFPFVQDGTRSSAEFRDRHDVWIRDMMRRRGVPFTVLNGTPAQRVACVRQVIGV